MSTEEPIDETGQGAASRRELAVARVLDPARERAETKVQAFLDAASELMRGPAGHDFTVQEVTERAGQSLRSFYQYFDGKYELLLALFEDSVRVAALQLQEATDRESDPLERLHVFVGEYYRISRAFPKGRTSKNGRTPALAEFAQQLLTDHPKEARHAFVPLIEMFEGLLDDAAAAGKIRAGLQHRRLTGVLLQAIMFNTFATTISGTSGHANDEAPEVLWDFIVHGIGVPAR